MTERSWFWRAWPGLCAVLIGVGLGRFAYTPMIPALVSNGWVTGAEAAYLGAANLAGYLAGALAAGLAARVLGATRAIRLALALSVLSLAACAFPLGFWWLAPWRLLIGVTGSVLMILAPSRIIIGIAPGERGRAGGVIYTGVGLGAALAAAFVGPIAAIGPSEAWAALAALALVATVLSWRRWQSSDGAPLPPAAARSRVSFSLPVLLLGLAYATDGIGVVPHTLFWVDFIARELARGTASGAFNWLLFGVGAAAGPIVAGVLGDRIGIGRTVALAFFVKMALVALPAALPNAVLLAASSLVVGALTPGLTALVATRLAELVPPGRQAQAWGAATLLFSATMALGGYAFSFAFAQLGAYRPLYAAGGLCEALGLALTLLHLRASRREHRANRQLGE
jgi:MFS family permease